jgi:hypothetical protein
MEEFQEHNPNIFNRLIVGGRLMIFGASRSVIQSPRLHEGPSAPTPIESVRPKADAEPLADSAEVNELLKEMGVTKKRITGSDNARKKLKEGETLHIPHFE